MDTVAATAGLPSSTATALRGALQTLEAATPQVFEVTDLLIPAGTNWSAVMHSLGVWTAPANGLHSRVIASLTIELDGDPAPGDDVWIGMEKGGTAFDNYDDAVGQVGAGVGVNLPSSMRYSGEYNIGIWAANALSTVPAPTTAPIYVVRARAAFLAI